MQRNNLYIMQSAISDSGFSWTAETTFLHDLDDNQQERYLGYVPADGEPALAVRESDSKAAMATFYNNKAFALAALPTSMDWRNHNGQNFVTTVKDQGACGSCVAFGAVATVESMVKIARGANTQVDLSEAHLYYCIARNQGRRCSGTNGGWWMQPAQAAFVNPGITDEDCYPYVAGDQDCTGLCANWPQRVTKTTGYQVLNSPDEIKDWLVNTGPVQSCFSVYTDFLNYYRSGVYRLVAGAAFRGGHCVCIVGYDDTLDCWICKNSWSTHWGESGFFRIGYGECGIDAQAYGVSGIAVSNN